MMRRERCGEVAKYRIEYGDGKVFYLCTRHFSNDDIQYLMTRKWVGINRLEDSEEKCQADVRKVRDTKKRPLHFRMVRPSEMEGNVGEAERQ